MADFTVKGADDFLKLSKALKEAGRTELRRDLHKALRAAVRAHTPKAERELAEHLPYLKGRQKAVSHVAQVKTGRDPGITVGVRYGSKRATNARLANNEGRFRHPVFADGEKTRKEWRWVNQEVPGAKGWFDQIWQDATPEVRGALDVVMQDIADRVVKGV